jgi:hypothetical protein
MWGLTEKAAFLIDLIIFFCPRPLLGILSGIFVFVSCQSEIQLNSLYESELCETWKMKLCETES